MKLSTAILSLAITLSASSIQAQSTQIRSITADDVPLANITHDAGLSSIFRTWGFIGDSLSSGEHEYHKEDGKLGYIDLYDYSWGQYMCRAMGATGDNYSQGGETAGGWIEHFWNQPKNNNNDIDAKLSPKQAYIIALGVNDHNRRIAPGDVKTDVVIDDYTKNAKTFAGNYAGIIQRVKTIQPDAKIFIVTTPFNEVPRAEYNNVIRSMADIFSNVYVIDLERHAPSYAPGSEIRENYYLGRHLTAAGYQLTAWMMMNYIDWIIRHNMDEFRQVAFIGSDKHF